MSDSTSTTPPRIPAPAAGGVAALRDLFARALAAAGPTYLPRQRWFGDKARAIAAVRLHEAAVVQVAGQSAALGIAEVEFVGGDPALYFLPLALTDEPKPIPSVVARIDEDPDGRSIVDALAVPAFHDWLLERLAAGAYDGGQFGAFAWRPGNALPGHLAAARAAASRISGAEQSNSAIVYGTSLLLKLFRKLQFGLNPDIELGRFLTERTTFRHLPPLLGDLTYVADGAPGLDISLAMAQPFVASQGDGWTVMLGRLAAHLKERSAGAGSTPALDLADRLGRRTAQLHVALAGDPSDPAFSPEPIDDSDIRRWMDDLSAALDRTLSDLQARADRLPAALQDAVRTSGSAKSGLTKRVACFRLLAGATKTRVHGDYHLGQILVTPEDDVVILDFEGEPARPLPERRAKTSPLKDVAGMLRSFGYARGAAARADAGGLDPVEVDHRLRAWEREARARFTQTYLAEARAAGAKFLPATGDDPAADGPFLDAVAAWELDKAVYEVNYELNNRPDWLELPLSTLLSP